MLRDSFQAVAAALGAGVCRGKAARRLILKNKKRKQDGTGATLRMVSSRRGRSAGISDFNLTFAQHYAPASLPGQTLCHLKSQIRLNSLLRPPPGRRATPTCGETGNIKIPF